MSKTPGCETFQGQSKVRIAPGETQIAVGPCRLVRVTVLVAGAGVANFYDDAAASIGNTWFVAPSAAPVGSIFKPDLPMDNGIHINNAGGGATYEVEYSQ